MEYLFTVKDVFEITGRGCVLIPGLPTKPDSPNVKVGAKIQLVMPNGASIDTEIVGIEMPNYRQIPEKIIRPILLSKAVEKKDIPVGTKVFLREETIKGAAAE